MSINTAALFDRARALVNGAVDSSGTRVSFLTRTSAGLSAPVDTVIGSANAILTVTDFSAQEMVAGVVIKPFDWKIVCKSATPIPADNTLVKIDRCKTRSLIGQVGKLIGVKTDSSGAHVTLFYRPQR